MSDALSPRILCGVRATGRLHLGNYFGAVYPFVSRLAQEPAIEAAYCFVADVHTLASPHDPATLQSHVHSMVLDLLACGVDPEKVTVFSQSSVSETSELAWVLSALTYVGELERNPNFKAQERAASQGEPVSAGVLNYPILMAADILGLRATHVSVGEDQYPHLELARDLARRFQRRFPAPESIFVEPQPLSTHPVRIPGLDGSGKMGKSQANSLSIDAAPELIHARIHAVATTAARPADRSKGTPERCPVFAYHRHASTSEQCETLAAGCRDGSLGCTECKSTLERSLSGWLSPLRAKREALAQRPDVAIETLRRGAVRAREAVRAVRDAVHARVGIERY
ncbi:MAG: tryptophan--tRNA ligase [Deltaproteobacteria bacterium]|nr:tryptophan--tRNA ligase [Deltaproteobacteria bacterium]